MRSSVGIATDYGLDDPESNPGGDEIFCPSWPALGPTHLLYNGYRDFPGGRGGRGVGLIAHPHLECRVSRKSRAIPLLTQRAFVACKKKRWKPTIPYAQTATFDSPMRLKAKHRLSHVVDSAYLQTFTDYTALCTDWPLFKVRLVVTSSMDTRFPTSSSAFIVPTRANFRPFPRFLLVI